MSTNTKRSSNLHKLCDFYASHTDPITCATLGQRSNRILATGSTDNTINCFRIGKTKPLMMFADNTAPITALQYNISDSNLCSGNRAGTVKVYDCSTAKQQYSYVGHRSSVTCIDWYPHLSPLVGTGSVDSTVRLWDLRKNGCAQTMSDKLDMSSVTCMKYCPDGKWVIVGNAIGVVRIWDNSTAKCIQSLQPCSTTSPIICIQLHPVEVIMACCTSTQVYVYDMDTFECIGTTPIDRNIRQIVFSEFSCDTVIVLCDTHIKIWNYAEQTCQLIDYIDATQFNKSIVCDVKINELNISEMYELTAVTRTDSSIAVYTVDMCTTELYRQMQPNDISTENIENDKPVTITNKPSSKPVSPNKQPKRAIDNPNNAFFSNKFDNVGSNVNVVRNDAVGAVVLSPNQPNPHTRPNSAVNSNNAIQTPFNAMQVLKHSPNGHSDATLRKSKQHWSAAPTAEKSLHIDSTVDTDMHTHTSPSTEHMSDSGRHMSVGVGQTLSPVGNGVTNNTTTVTPVLPPARYPQQPSVQPTTAPPVPAKPTIQSVVPTIPAKPVVQQSTPVQPTQPTAADICTSLLQMNTVVIQTLQPRLSTIRSIRKSWLTGDIQTVISESIQCTDFILIHNILTTSESVLRDKLLTLDYCTQLTTVLCKMLASQTPQPIATALRYMQWICIQFNDIFKTALMSQQNNNSVDLAKEERLNKAIECYKRMKHIYPRLAALSQREQPIGLLAKDFRVRLDTLIGIEKKAGGPPK